MTITITAASSLMSAIGGNDVCIDESQYGPCDVVEASGGPAFHFVLSGPGGSSEITVTPGTPFTQEFTSGGTLSLGGLISTNPFACGDANHDGIVCWADRAGARAAVPAEVGDSSYNPAFDCNGDGEVTQEEIDDAYTSCSMFDFNCDGIVDFNDYLDFSDAFSGPDLSADVNGDSLVDFNDYLDFVDGYGSC